MEENPIRSIVDIIGREYGWTVDYIMGLTKQEVYAMLDAVSYRYKKEKEAFDDTKNKSNSKSSSSGVKPFQPTPEMMSKFNVKRGP